MNVIINKTSYKVGVKGSNTMHQPGLLRTQTTTMAPIAPLLSPIAII